MIILSFESVSIYIPRCFLLEDASHPQPRLYIQSFQLIDIGQYLKVRLLLGVGPSYHVPSQAPSQSKFQISKGLELIAKGHTLIATHNRITTDLVQILWFQNGVDWSFLGSLRLKRAQQGFQDCPVACFHGLKCDLQLVSYNSQIISRSVQVQYFGLATTIELHSNFQIFLNLFSCTTKHFLVFNPLTPKNIETAYQNCQGPPSEYSCLSLGTKNISTRIARMKVLALKVKYLIGDRLSLRHSCQLLLHYHSTWIQNRADS